MIQLLYDVSFIDYWFDLLLADQLVLAHDFHCIESTCIFLTDQDDSAEFLVQDCDYDSMVADSANAAVTVEDDAQKEMLGSFFYIDEKGRQRRRSHRLSKVPLVSGPN